MRTCEQTIFVSRFFCLLSYDFRGHKCLLGLDFKIFIF
jgi:hypothetical protein